MTKMIITANHLHDGSVVWMNATLEWSRNRGEAEQFDPDAATAAQEAAKASMQQNQVIGVYEVPADGKADQSARELIRGAGGPSITPPADRRGLEDSMVAS